MAITMAAKSGKYYRDAVKSNEKLEQTVKQILEPHKDESIYKTIKEKEDIAQIKALGQQVFGEVINARDIKSEMKNLRDLNAAVEKISYVNNKPKKSKYTAVEINEANKVFNLAKERAGKYVKAQYTASNYNNDPHLIINTYIDYLQAKYEKEKDIFELARYDQAKASSYRLVHKNPSKDLINKMETDSMKRINERLAFEVGNIKSIENKYAEFKGMSDPMYTYINGLHFADKKNTGVPLAMDRATAEAPKQFWKKMSEADSKIVVTEGMKTNPDYLKAEALSQFFSGDQMNALLSRDLAGANSKLTNQLNEIASNYHIRGVKKKMVEMRKEYKAFMKSEDVKAIKEMLEKAVKLGGTKNSWFGASREKEYDSFVRSHADLFLKKDADGYTKFQTTAAWIMAYEAAFGTLREISTVGTKNVAKDQIKKERTDAVNELVQNVLNGKVYSEFIGSNGAQKPELKAQAYFDTSKMATLGYSKITDLLDSTKSLGISGLSKVEQDEFEKARKKIEDAAAANTQVDAIDAFSVIKYGNKAMLLQFENLLPSKSRASIKRSLIGQFDGIDVSSKDAAEKLEKARASFLTSVLFESQSSSVTGAVRKALGTLEYKKARRTILDAYGNDFTGYTDASWSYVNDVLKKACSSVQGMVFV